MAIHLFNKLFRLYKYGDKVPKSTLARSFAVVWMIVGVTVCSVLTATLSDALTSVKLEHELTAGKRVRFLDHVKLLDESALYFELNVFHSTKMSAICFCKVFQINSNLLFCRGKIYMTIYRCSVQF